MILWRIGTLFSDNLESFERIFTSTGAKVLNILRRGCAELFDNPEKKSKSKDSVHENDLMNPI